MSRQSDSKETKQVRIDTSYHRELRILAAHRGTTMGVLIEEQLDRLFEDHEAARAARDTEA